ncbi:PAS domain S-box protein [Cellulomonas rhizosphaerae]|uniref:histidine kinase n=1 Tax=Cellulomonas rhizosphaerae TaxID=2293719 RepID=A0A413RMN4_9CELL|nr:PAS domain S-box protein [Cellulomonas rhizosphaerae]
MVETDDDLRSRGARWLRVLGRVIGPEAGVFERQLPFVLVYALALVALTVIPTILVDASSLWLGSAVAALVIVLAWALPWHRWPESAQIALPVLQFVAIAMLRTGTGGIASPFGSILFLPAVMLAGRPGRAGVVVGTLGVAAVVEVPVILDAEAEVTTQLFLRSLFVAVVAGTVGVIVHEATSRLRARNAALAALQVEQLRLNEQLTADAEALASLVRETEASRAHLGSVMDAVTEQAIVATDADGLVEVFNPGAERMFGYTRDEVVGRRSLVSLFDHGQLEARYREVFEVDATAAAEADEEALFAAVAAPTITSGVLVRDWTFRRHDGSCGTLQLAVTRRIDGKGSTIGYVVVAADVTLEREAARLKDQFVSLVSHELRTPLSSVLSYVDLILDGPDPLTDEQREFLLVVERNARRQLRLVSDLLLTAQLDAGRFTIAHQDVDLADVARATLAEAAPGAEGAGVTLHLEAEPVHVPGDAMRLEQVVANLVSNAVKFTPRGGRIDVRVAAAPAGGAVVSVADTGIGIAPDELDRLATRFFRASTATQRAIPGIGLGLSIAKAIVEAHGGELTIASRVGEGTTFTFTLPGA